MTACEPRISSKAPSTARGGGCTHGDGLTCPKEVIDDGNDALVGGLEVGVLPCCLSLLAVPDQRVCDVPDVLLGKSQGVRGTRAGEASRYPAPGGTSSSFPHEHKGGMLEAGGARFSTQQGAAGFGGGQAAEPSWWVRRAGGISSVRELGTSCSKTISSRGSTTSHKQQNWIWASSSEAQFH